MLRAARRATAALPDPAAVIAFVRNQALPDGSFRDRSGKGDLYYTVFGLQCLRALDALDEPAAEAAGYSRTCAERYLGSFGDPRALDFVHAACLARSWALVRPRHPTGRADVRSALAARLEAFRSTDGGYNPVAGSAAGSAYGCFLALGAWQDLALEAPDAAGIVQCVRSLRTADGGYTNEAGLPFASAPATAACAVVIAEAGEPVDKSAARYLLNCAHPSGGFVAMARAPAADLLSTATGLHALAQMDAPPDQATALATLGFVAGLAMESGGFRGSEDDPVADCEYTFYGLLALGHLAGGH
jgi:hypothetical protein